MEEEKDIECTHFCETCGGCGHDHEEFDDEENGILTFVDDDGKDVRFEILDVVTMDEKEYDTLSDEFEIILKQMDLIGKIDNIENVEPLIYPFQVDNVKMREDVVIDELPIEDILQNSGDNLYNQVKLPKVVE